jgi:hypothetical protein
VSAVGQEREKAPEADDFALGALLGLAVACARTLAAVVDCSA